MGRGARKAMCAGLDMGVAPEARPPRGDHEERPLLGAGRKHKSARTAAKPVVPPQPAPPRGTPPSWRIADDYADVIEHKIALAAAGRTRSCDFRIEAIVRRFRAREAPT